MRFDDHPLMDEEMCRRAVNGTRGVDLRGWKRLSEWGPRWVLGQARRTPMPIFSRR